MLIRTIIIDDEVRGANSLQKMLSYSQPEIEVIAVCNSPVEAIPIIKELKPDLLFLDIQMPHLTGFEMLEEIGEIPFEVIFTTAYDQYALKAFKYAAADYLLKPIDMDELDAAIKKVMSRHANKQAVSPLDKLFQTIQNDQATIRKISLPTGNGLQFVEISDIIRMESSSNYTTIFIQNQKPLLVSRTLKEFEDQLTSKGFLRVHNSHLINIQHIKTYTKGEGGTVTMADNSQVDVSRRKKEEFLSVLERLMGR